MYSGYNIHFFQKQCFFFLFCNPIFTFFGLPFLPPLPSFYNECQSNKFGTGWCKTQSLMLKGMYSCYKTVFFPRKKKFSLFCNLIFTFFCLSFLPPLPSFYNECQSNKFGTGWCKVQSWVSKVMYSGYKIHLKKMHFFHFVIQNLLSFVFPFSHPCHHFTMNDKKN